MSQKLLKSKTYNAQSVYIHLSLLYLALMEWKRSPMLIDFKKPTFVRRRVHRVRWKDTRSKQQTVQSCCRLEEWRKDPSAPRLSHRFMLSSLLLIQISYSPKCAITLVTLENLPLCRLNKWQKDPPTTLRRLYATWNWKSAHWKPLVDFRETFCIVSSTQFAATKARRLKVI